jgi:hypothetical protein
MFAIIAPAVGESIQTAATDAVSTIVIAAIGLLSMAATTALTVLGRKASAWLEHRLASNAYDGAITLMTEVTKSLVLEAERTLVKEAKEAAKDGKLTKEEGLRIRDEVFKRAKEHFGDIGLGRLQKGLGGDLPMVERMIRTHIETRLHETQIERNGHSPTKIGRL